MTFSCLLPLQANYGHYSFCHFLTQNTFIWKNRHSTSPSSKVSNAGISKISHEVCILLPLYSPYTKARKMLTWPVRIVAFNWWKKDSECLRCGHVSTLQWENKAAAQSLRDALRGQGASNGYLVLQIRELVKLGLPSGIMLVPHPLAGKGKSSKDNRSVWLLQRSTS